jgi:hypothetical protein
MTTLSSTYYKLETPLGVIRGTNPQINPLLWAFLNIQATTSPTILSYNGDKDPLALLLYVF